MSTKRDLILLVLLYATAIALGSLSGSALCQSVPPAARAQSEAGDSSKIRYLTARNFDWNATIAGERVTGPQKLAFTACPRGIFGDDRSSYVSVNDGAEYPLLTGEGNCVPGKPGTVTFALRGTYTNPVIRSASTGMQEAIIDAESNGTHLLGSNWKVVMEPTNPPSASYYTCGARVTIAAGMAEIDGSGATVDAEGPETCFYLTKKTTSVRIHGFRVASKTIMRGVAVTKADCGDTTPNTMTVFSQLNPGLGTWIDIQNTDNTRLWGLHGPVIASSPTRFQYSDFSSRGCHGNGVIRNTASLGAAAMLHAFIRDDGNHNSFDDITVDNPAWAAANALNNVIVVENDQSFNVSRFNANGTGVNCDALYCGEEIYAPGPFAVNAAAGHVTNSNISPQCAGNGIKWMSGNTISVSDSVIQGFAQFGLISGTPRGGYGPTQQANTYFEVGNCTNPWYTLEGFSGIAAQGIAGTLVNGNDLFSVGNGRSVGQEPQFATGGSTWYEYWAVIHDGDRASIPLRFGQAAPTGSAPVKIGWARYASPLGNVVTYDVLKTVGIGFNLTAPLADGLNHPIAVATGIGQCQGLICTWTDNQLPLKTYAVGANATLVPQLWFWPGGVILGAGATYYANTLTTTVLSAVVPTVDNVPTVFVQQCDDPTPGIYISCLAGNSVANNNPSIGATLMQNGPAQGGQAKGLKGRLNMIPGLNVSLSRGHIITLVDSNSAKTLADPNHRPPNDPSDTYIGLDNASVGAMDAQLAFGAPVSISNYIRNPGDEVHWKERLTDSLKSYAVPLSLNSGIIEYNGIPTSGTGVAPILGEPVSLEGRTGDLKSTTLYVTRASGHGAAGMYRVCVTLWPTETGNTSALQAKATAPTSAGTVVLPVGAPLDTSKLTNGGGGCQVLHVAAGAAIQVSTTGYKTTGTYSIQATLEQLQ
jgi:hypothetical protein